METKPTGLGSGLDIESLVKNLVEASSGKLKKLQAKQKENQDTLSLNKDAMSKVDSLKASFESLRSTLLEDTSTTSNITEAFNKFVSEFNSINQMKGDNRELRDTVSRLRSGLMTRVESDLGGMFSLGLATSRDGSLTFDSARFGQVWKDQKSQVQTTVSQAATNFTQSTSSLTGYASPLGRKNLSILSQNARLSEQIQNEEKLLDKKAEQLYSQYGKMDALVASLNQMGQKFNQLG